MMYPLMGVRIPVRDSENACIYTGLLQPTAVRGFSTDTALKPIIVYKMKYNRYVLSKEAQKPT
jgi:hypothetical protein